MAAGSAGRCLRLFLLDPRVTLRELHLSMAPLHVALTDQDLVGLTGQSTLEVVGTGGAARGLPTRPVWFGGVADA